MKRLAPGIYDDEHGGMHLDLTELLAAHGFPDTGHDGPYAGFAIVRVADQEKSITCFACGFTSFNPNDVANKYCGNCHVFHEGAAP